MLFFFSSRRRHTRCLSDWSSDVCSSDLHLVEGAAARMVDQPLVGHILEQRLEFDLVLPRKPKRPRDLALPRRLVGRSDKIEDLLAVGQAGRSVARLLARRSG